jgi:hypothetical protein
MPVFYDKNKMQPISKVLILNFALLLMELSWNTIGIDPTGRFGITNEAIYGTIFLTAGIDCSVVSK